MKQVLTVELPADLLGVAKKMIGTPGVPVTIPRALVTQIDNVIQQTLADTLKDVRERERSTSSEALKLRIR